MSWTSLTMRLRRNSNTSTPINARIMGVYAPWQGIRRQPASVRYNSGMKQHGITSFSTRSGGGLE